mmetsp:Transcript_15687/g.35687  ORF Transcript_15687/g.35687 Transcript_15687/m.35687 type:complete len:220 (-) Transcript_15687:162-821(-)
MNGLKLCGDVTRNPFARATPVRRRMFLLLPNPLLGRMQCRLLGIHIGSRHSFQLSVQVDPTQVFGQDSLKKKLTLIRVVSTGLGTPPLQILPLHIPVQVNPAQVLGKNSLKKNPALIWGVSTGLNTQRLHVLCLSLPVPLGLPRDIGNIHLGRRKIRHERSVLCAVQSLLHRQSTHARSVMVQTRAARMPGGQPYLLRLRQPLLLRQFLSRLSIMKRVR